MMNFILLSEHCAGDGDRKEGAGCGDQGPHAPRAKSGQIMMMVVMMMMMMMILIMIM